MKKLELDDYVAFSGLGISLFILAIICGFIIWGLV